MNKVEHLTKKKFREYGINKYYLTNIIKEKHRSKVKDFEIKRIERGSFRTNLYEFKLKLYNGKNVTLFGKEFFKWGLNTDITGKIREEKDLELNEVHFLKYFTMYNGFGPVFYDNVLFSDANKKNHMLILMEKFDCDFEDKLEEYYQKLEKLEQVDKRKIKKEDLYIEKEKIYGEVIDYLGRAIDMLIVNNHIVTKHYRSIDELGRAVVYKFNKDTFKRDLNNYVFRFLDFVFSNRDTERICSINYPLSFIMKSLYQYVAEPLSRVSENENNLVFLNLHPAHILLKKKRLEKYDSDAIIEAADGKNTSAYNGITLTDFDKIAFGTNAMGVATLLNHPSVTRILPFRLIKERLCEHAIWAEQRIRQTEQKGKDLEALVVENRGKFFEEYYPASRFTILRNICFITQLNKNYPEKAEKLIEIKPLYEPRAFIQQNIENLLKLERSENFKTLNEFFSEIKNKYLN